MQRRTLIQNAAAGAVTLALPTMPRAAESPKEVRLNE